MKKYLIKVIKGNEKAEYKKFIGSDVLDAINRAVEDGYTVISKEKDITEDTGEEIILIKKITPSQLLSFFQNVGNYLTFSINIKDSIEKIKRNSKGGYYKMFLNDLYNSIEKGLNLYEAISNSKYKKFFSYSQLEMIRVGINSDNMGEIFKTLVEELKLEKKIKGDIKSVMIMPMIAIVLILISSLVLFIYVLPNILKAIGKIEHYPFFTQILINIKDFVVDFKYVLVIFVSILLFLPKILKIHPKTRYYYDYFIINIPVLKNLIKVRTYLQIAKILEITSKSEFSSKDKLVMLSKGVENSYYRKYFEDKVSELILGKEFYVQFINEKLFSYDLSDVIQIGDETMNLDKIMAIYYNETYNDFKKTIDDLKNWITALVIIFLGLFVLLFAGGIYQLLLSLNDTIK